MKTLLVTLQPFTVQFSKEQITFYTLLNHFAKGFQKTFLVEYLYVAASGIQTSVFAERLLQLHMILKKLLFLFKSTDLTGLNCFKAGYEAGHSNRVLTRGHQADQNLRKTNIMRSCDVITNFSTSEMKFKVFC